MTQTELDAALLQLGIDFNPHNICFSLSGTEDIKSDLFYYGGFSNPNPPYQNNLTSVLGINPVPNAINIYFFPNNLANQSFSGIAKNIPSNAFVIGGTYSGTLINNTSRILSHEMGHCLGLYHTHHQIEQGGCSDCSNGTNCLTCGDYVCDTPPDPFLLPYPNPNCVNIPFTATDPCGAVFNPDENNIMSYTPMPCMQYFSNNQGYRMRLMITNSSILQAASIPAAYYIQNQSIFSGDFLYATSSSITAGANVTSGLTGDVIYGDNSRIVYRTKKFIKLEPGFLAFPDYSGSGSEDASFHAYIDPNICNLLEINNAKIFTSTAYKPMLKTSKWFTHARTFEGAINRVFESFNDTFVLGKKYILIKETFVNLPGIFNNPFQNTGVSPYYMVFREDSIQKKVYQLNNFNSEVLLYDFNLTIGSSHPLDPSYSVITKDSISTINGFSNRLIFSNNFDSIIWLEGIGNIASPFVSNSGFNSSQSFLSSVICAYQNNTLVYTNDNLVPNVTCSSFVGLEDIQGKRFRVSVFPNPTSGKISIVLPPPVEQFVDIDLQDCYGRSVFKIKSNKNILEIDLGFLPKGIYSLRINAFNQSTQNKVVLLE